MSFDHDLLENEKHDPQEASSLKFVNIPVILLSLFVGFGATYLAMKTPSTQMSPGDSRISQEVASTSGGAAISNETLEVLMDRGKQVYTTTCQACHQAGGAGIPGAFPPLDGSDWVTGSDKRLVAIILHGVQGEITVKGQKFQGVMPTFKDQLTSMDVAAVSTYVRNSFGNKAEKVKVQTVEEVRESTKDRNGSWNGEVELKSKDWGE